MDFNEIIFKGKSVADLFEEIYKDKQEKQKQLKGLINMLKDLVTDGGDAIMLMPQIKELMDLDIKNNDTLLRMTAIIQKYQAAQARSMAETGMGEISEEEKRLLLESLEELGIGGD